MEMSGFMKLYKRILSLVLCAAVVLGMMGTVWADNESNLDYIYFTAKPDKLTLEKSSQDQTVILTICPTDSLARLSLNQINVDLFWDEPLTLKRVFHEDSAVQFSDDSVNLDTGEVYWQSASTLSEIPSVLSAEFVIPAGTPAGIYQIGADPIILHDYLGVWESSASVSATLTITEPAQALGYSAALRSLTPSPAAGDTVYIPVDITHSSDTHFAAGELVLDYDSNLLRFNTAKSTLGAAQVKDTGGRLTLEDYGADKPLGSGVYTLAFDTLASGDAAISLISAAFVNKTDAVKSDLIPAVSLGALTVPIANPSYSVTLPDIFTGNTEVTRGETYTFSAKDPVHYTYNTVTATMDGQEATVKNMGSGNYEIENVTGPLVISGSRTPNSYAVTFDGSGKDDIPDAPETATYGIDYVFTLPTAAGYAYSVDKITVGGDAYTGFSMDGTTCRIPGTAITGAMVITVSKTQTEVPVSVTGDGAGIAVGYAASAVVGQPYTLTVRPESGYKYDITATMGGTAAELTVQGNNYTVASVTGELVFTIDRAVITDTLQVQEYLQLNGAKMYLVTFSPSLDTGKVPTCDGTPMYWSDDYRAYCWLVIANTLTAEALSSRMGVADGSAETVPADMDVNRTGKVDASDAQLVYNMYSAVYPDFTDEVTLLKFLLADTNHDKTVTVEDAAAIIHKILN